MTTRARALGFIVAVTAIGCTEDLPSEATWKRGYARIERGEGPTGYITNNGEDTVSVIRLRTLEEVARIPVGLDIVSDEAPHHLVVDPEGGYLFVGLSNVLPSGGQGVHAIHGGGAIDSFVERRDLDTLAPVDFVRVSSNLGDVLFAPSSRRVVTTHFDLKRAQDAQTNGSGPEEAWADLVVVNADTMTRESSVKVGVAPHGAVFTEDARRVFVACYGDDRIAVVDLDDTGRATIAERVPVGDQASELVPPRYGPYALALHPGGKRVFIGSTDSKDVRAIDTESLAMESAIASVDGAAFFGAFSEDGSRYYVPTQGADSLAVVDTATMTVIDSRFWRTSECIAPHLVVRVDGEPNLFVLCEGDHESPGTLLAVDPETLEITRTLEVGVYPDALVVRGAGE